MTAQNILDSMKGLPSARLRYAQFRRAVRDVGGLWERLGVPKGFRDKFEGEYCCKFSVANLAHVLSHLQRLKECRGVLVGLVGVVRLREELLEDIVERKALDADRVKTLSSLTLEVAKGISLYKVDGVASPK